MEDLRKYNPEGSTLRKAQMRMLDILLVVDKIFRKHHIEYWLDGGTLLGAVRHGGFIPWDDDLDINVRQTDIPRIRKILQSELPENLCYQDVTTDWNYTMLICKVRDKNSIFNDNYFIRLKERGIYIDLIPMEEVVPLRLKEIIDFVYVRCVRGADEISIENIRKIAKNIRQIMFMKRGMENMGADAGDIAFAIMDYAKECDERFAVMPEDELDQLMFNRMLESLLGERLDEKIDPETAA